MEGCFLGRKETLLYTAAAWQTLLKFSKYLSWYCSPKVSISLQSLLTCKLSSFCRLLSWVYWEMLSLLLRYCFQDFICFVSNATALWIGEICLQILLAGFMCVECKLVRWSLVLRIFSFGNTFGTQFSAFVLVNSGSGAWWEQSREGRRERHLPVQLWSPVWLRWVNLHCGVKQCGTTQEFCYLLFTKYVSLKKHKNTGKHTLALAVLLIYLGGGHNVGQKLFLASFVCRYLGLEFPCWVQAHFVQAQ